MCAPSPAVRTSSGGVPRRAATATSDDTSERASSGNKRTRVGGVAPARDASACLTKTTRDRNGVATAVDMEVVLTAAGEVSSQKLLQKRLASELDALRGLLKKAELISRRVACKGGGGLPAAGEKERFLAPKRRPKPIEDGGAKVNVPSVKRRKISTPVEQKQKQMPTPRMSPDERNQLAGRLSSLCGEGELPAHIVEFLQKQFGDADDRGEIGINIDSVEDSVLFELKTQLDKLAEESKDDKKVVEESKGEVVLEQESKGDADHDQIQIMDTSAQQPSEPASRTTAQSTVEAAESVSCESIGDAAQNGEAKEVQRFVPKAVYMPGLLYRANLRRQLLEMERAALPYESIHPRDLQRLGIAEYGHPTIMRQLGLVLKADA